MLVTSRWALVGDGLSPDLQKQHSDQAWVIRIHLPLEFPFFYTYDTGGI